MGTEMEAEVFESNKHMGLKIGGARRLVGITQKELAERLGITRQAISKLEQTENVDDERLEKIADALGVSLEGLKKFDVGTVLYYTTNFYENVSATNGGMVGAPKVENNYAAITMDQAFILFEELLKMKREKFESFKDEDK